MATPTFSTISPNHVSNGTMVLYYGLSGTNIERGASVVYEHPVGTPFAEVTALTDPAVVVVSSTELRVVPPPSTIQKIGGSWGATIAVSADLGLYGIRIKNPGGELSNQVILEVLSSGVNNNAQFISWNMGVPPTMTTGGSYPVSITMKNTGTADWLIFSNYKLGSQSPQDNVTWGLSRVQLFALEPVTAAAPGSNYTFSFTVTAPLQPGTYNFRWRMVQEDIAWFGDFTPLAVITVNSPAPVAGVGGVTVNLSRTRQTFQGIGAQDFRWLSDEVLFGRFVGGQMSNVLQFTLDTLHPSHTYFSIPLRLWEPDNDDNDAAHFTLGGFGIGSETGFLNLFSLMQEYERRGMKMVITANTAGFFPSWLKALPNLRDELIELVSAFLLRAKETYSVTVDRFSIGEPESEPLFTPAFVTDFVKVAAARFTALGLTTRLQAGHAAFPSALRFATPTLEDSIARGFVDTLAYHSWGAEGRPEDIAPNNVILSDIGGLAQQYGKTVTVPELGADAGNFSYGPPVYSSWNHAWRQAQMYVRVLRYSRASVVNGGWFDRDYPMVDPVSLAPFPAFYVTKQLMDNLPSGSEVVEASANPDALWVLAAKHVKNDHFMLQVLNTAFTSIEVTFGGLPNTDLTIQRTRDGEYLQQVGSVPAGTGPFTLTLPAQSVTLLSGKLEKGMVPMATSTQVTTLADMRTDLLRRVREAVGVAATNAMADSWINQALMDLHISPGHQWPWAVRRGYLQTHAPYNAGTVTIAAATRTTVTGSSTLWNTAISGMGFNNVRVGGKITFGGGAEIYEVSAVGSDTSLTLSSRYVSDALSAASYAYFEDEYPLATDFYRPVDLRNFTTETDIPLVGPQEFRRRFARNSRSGRPNVATILQLNFATDTSARYRVALHPAPSAIYHIPYDYITSNLAVSSAGVEQTQLTADADEPIIPLRYRHVLVLGALYQWLRDRRDDARSGEVRAEYTQLITRMAGDLIVGTDNPRFVPMVGVYYQQARNPRRRGGRYDPGGLFDTLRI